MLSPSAETTVKEIRAVLAQFQAGYIQRDPRVLDAFMDLFSNESGLAGHK